ncbi:MAG: fasciclin domain-containing protein [Bacteroidota bacterium]
MKNLTRISAFTALCLAITLAFSACQKEQLVSSATSTATNNGAGVVSDRNNGTIVDIAVSNPAFTTLVAAVLKTNLAGFLSDAALNGTVFAPTNDAFAQLPYPFNDANGINSITDPKTIATLRAIVQYHVLTGKRNAAQLTNGSYNTYKNAATPNDNLLYVGRSANNDVYLNGNVKVTAVDIQASNGVIHVINKVLFFPTQDILQIAAGNGGFTALVAAIKKTGLTGVVTLPQGNFTVFAPTDAAFAALPAPLNNAANIKSITDQATIDLLRNVLRYHLIGARVFSADLREGITAPTVLAGNNVSISLAGGAKVKGTGNSTGSNIVLTDLLARNGVIHVIDQVLLP